MSGEMEAIGLASVGALGSGQKADLSGQPCKNCGAPVEGRYCPKCGQLAASFHRPIWSLVAETIEDTLALDGRLARTLPKLFLRPGMLTRAYTSGQRARYVPPFRLFLLASLVFYFALFAIIGNASWVDDIRMQGDEDAPLTVNIGEGEDAEERVLIDENGNVDRDVARDMVNEGEGGEEVDFVVNGVANVVEDPRLFLFSLEQWVPRMSLLLVPITIFALTFLHIWRRKLYVYDHAIHALHLHTWMYLTGALTMVLGMVVGGWVGYFFLIAFILYVWRSLAVATRSGFFMSGIRLFLMLLVWTISAAVLAVISIVLGATTI